MERYTLRIATFSENTRVPVLTDSQGNRVELWPHDGTQGAEIYQRGVYPYRADIPTTERAVQLIARARAQLERHYMQQTPDSVWLPETINNWLERRDFAQQLNNGKALTFHADPGLIGQLIPPSAPRYPGYDPRSTREPDQYGR